MFKKLKKQSGGFWKFLSVVGMIVTIVSLAVAVIYYWDAITNTARRIFPGLPKIKLFSGKCDYGDYDDSDEFADFADV
ncbi:MAG: hypothetical protein LBD85_03095 [Oscillospiraceae bacterium]|jgi:hypothetical protein|nr:hypothetical protein [Oscillospiraceae bacterium]